MEITLSKLDVIDKFIFRTYRIWNSGKIVHLIANSKEMADSMPYTEFKKYVNNLIEFSISSILEKTDLLDDEFLISSDQKNGKVFIITDQRLFISPVNNLNEGMDIIILKDIKTIKFKPGWSTSSGVISLNDDKIFNYNKLDCCINEDFINKLKSTDNSHFILGPIDNKVLKDSSTKIFNFGSISFNFVGVAAGLFFLYANKEKLISGASFIIYGIGALIIAYFTSKMFKGLF